MNIKSFKTLSNFTFKLFLFLGCASLFWFFIVEKGLLGQLLLLLALQLTALVVTLIVVKMIKGKRVFLRSILTILFVLSMFVGGCVFYILNSISSVQGLPGKIIFSDNYTLGAGEKLAGDLVVFGSNVAIEEDADLNGNLVVFGGTISSNGSVSGDIVVFGGQIKLDENAVVSGDVVTIGGQVDRAEGAVIKGQVVNNGSPTVQISNGQIPPNVDPPEASNNTVSVVLLVTTALTALISAISGAIAQFAAHKKSLADIEIEKQKLALERDKFELEKSKSQPRRKSKSHK